jgi:hypothetical protein
MTRLRVVFIRIVSQYQSVRGKTDAEDCWEGGGVADSGECEKASIGERGRRNLIVKGTQQGSSRTLNLTWVAQ